MNMKNNNGALKLFSVLLVLMLALYGCSGSNEDSPTIGNPTIGNPTIGDPTIGDPTISDSAIVDQPTGDLLTPLTVAPSASQ